MATLSYLEDKAYSDPISSSKYIVFEDGKLRHLFQVDETSISNYQLFGDVIAFDATYKKKKKKQVQPSFGYFFWQKSSCPSYKWMLETILESIRKKIQQLWL